jgi:hypothetical protein
LNAAQLISLANARGVDLVRAAGAATETEGIARKRALTEEEKKQGIRDVRETAAGRETRTYRQGAWSFAELGQAAAAGGVRGAPWQAIRYSIMGDRSCEGTLHLSLAIEANFLARRDWWAPQVVGCDGQRKFYREELAMLVLDADLHRQYFAWAPQLYAVYMAVDGAIWNRDLESQFASLNAKYQSWISTAMGGIQRGLRGN